MRAVAGDFPCAGIRTKFWVATGVPVEHVTFYGAGVNVALHQSRFEDQVDKKHEKQTITCQKDKEARSCGS
jgi:hypothetical protein